MSYLFNLICVLIQVFYLVGLICRCFVKRWVKWRRKPVCVRQSVTGEQYAERTLTALHVIGNPRICELVMRSHTRHVVARNYSSVLLRISAKKMSPHCVGYDEKASNGQCLPSPVPCSGGWCQVTLTAPPLTSAAATSPLAALALHHVRLVHVFMFR